MAVLPISPGNDLNGLMVFCTMIFPEDQKKREALIIMKLSEALADNNQDIPGSYLSYLREAPSNSEIAKASDQGCVAGAILWTLHTMVIARAGEPSLRKAYHLVSKDRGETTNYSGNDLTKSDPYLRKSFIEFQSVAHLWAAYEEMRRQMGAYALRGSTKPPPPFKTVVSRCATMLLSPILFDCFLRLAEKYRKFGETFISSRGQKQNSPALNESTTWKVPSSIKLPDMVWESGVLSEWMHRALDTYHQEKRETAKWGS